MSTENPTDTSADGRTESDVVQAFETLARSARADAPPPIDVRDAVLADLHAGTARTQPLYWMFAAASSAAAAVLLALAVRTLWFAPAMPLDLAPNVMGMLP